MKKNLLVKLVALTLILACMVPVLGSCAKRISGTYTGKADLFGLAGADVTYKFSGNKVTVTTVANVLGFEKTTEYKGTYEITEKDDGNLQITFTYEGDGSSNSGTVSFVQGKDSVTIGGVTYNKAK